MASTLAGIVMRRATDADIPDVLTFLTLCYGGNNVTNSDAYWRWKHITNPFGVSPVLLALSGQQIVGLRVFMRWTWHVGARAIAAVRAVDTATHPDFRGRGIFSALTQQLCIVMRSEGVSFVFNTPNDNSMPGYLKMGWQLVGRLPLLVKPGRASSISRRWIRPQAPTAPSLANLCSVEDVLANPALDLIVARSPVSMRLHTRRDIDYLTWRYTRVPTLRYAAWIDTSGTDAAAVIVRGRLRGRLRELSISDVLYTPTLRGIRCARRALAAVRARTNVDYLVSTAANGSPTQRALLGAGFVPLGRRGPHFTIRALSDDVINPQHWHCWQPTVGALELF